MRRPFAILSLLAVMFGTQGGGASAKATYESAYGFDRTWNAAMRLVRVDMGMKITERDEASGYLLFEYKSPESGGKASSGSMEFLRRDQQVNVVVQLPEMPQYHEQVMIDRLARKMRVEYGEAPKAQPAPKPQPKDAGADAPAIEEK
jgi:hypothetical protein